MDLKQEIDDLADWSGTGAERMPPEAGFLVCDSQGKVVICSPYAAETYGDDPRALEGRQINMLLSEISPAGIPSNRRRMDLDELSNKVGIWRRVNVEHTDGRRIQLIVSVERLEINQVCHFLLYLRRPHDVFRQAGNDPKGAQNESRLFRL